MSRVSDKPYFLYVLWSVSARRFYIGITDDVKHRLGQHNAGKSKWTAKFGPWKLVYSEPHTNYSAARRRELLLKRQKGGAGFFRLTRLEMREFRPSGTQSGS
jgi:putative endonuclease